MGRALIHIWLGTVAAVMLAPMPARAQEARIQVAALPLGFDGDIPATTRDLMARRLVEGLTAARFEVRQVPEATTCREASCYPTLATTLGVSYLVVGRVEERSKSYQISLDLINGRTGAAIGTTHERCETCGIEEAGEKLALAATSVRARLDAFTRAPGRLVVRSRPAGARAQIDGRSHGRTPLDLQLPAGEHRLSLTLDGYGSAERMFTIVSGFDEVLQIDLAPLPRTFPFTALGWTGLIVGAAALAGGVWALVVDGREIPCADDRRGHFGHCPEVYETTALGLGLVMAGTASASLGGLSLFLGTTGRGGAMGDRAAAVYGVVVRGRY